MFTHYDARSNVKLNDGFRDRENSEYYSIVLESVDVSILGHGFPLPFSPFIVLPFNLEGHYDKYLDDRHYGCRRDVSNNRSLPGPMAIFPDNEPYRCMGYCRSYVLFLAGLENGTQCFCGSGDVFKDHGTLPDSECNMRCPGDPRFSCGGTLAFDYYFAY